MKKYWLVLLGATILATGCVSTYRPYSGPVNELRGAQIHYEPVNPASLAVYRANGKRYRAITKPAGYREQGVATWFSDDQQGRTTLTGEQIDNHGFIGAHPRLPLPSYVSVTNMNNGRQIVVRLIDRAPLKEGTAIALSRTVAERLMLTERTAVQIDYIEVSPDGHISGEQAKHAEEVRQSYPLPTPPDILIK